MSKKRRKNRTRRARKSNRKLMQVKAAVEHLEPRQLLDAGGLSELVQTSGLDFGQELNTRFDAVELGTSEASLAKPVRQEIIFVDVGVSDSASMLAEFDSDAEVVMLSADQDGVSQIAAALGGRMDISAVHIISHGDQAELRLGNATLTVESMQGEHVDELNAIRAALSDSGDILIYGCDFGKGEAGSSAAEQLSKRTGADVAASDDLTGSEDKGGDWELERNVGEVETLSLVATNWEGVLTPTVSDPSGQDIGEPGANTVFSIANGNAISVSDPTGGGADVLFQIKIDVPGATLTLAQATGLTTASGDGTSEIVINGSPNDINDAVDGLVLSTGAGTSTSLNYGLDITVIRVRDAGFVNAGFELPDFAQDGGFNLTNESTVPGWGTSASDNLIEIWETGHAGVASFEGDQHAEHNANEVSTLSQVFTPAVGIDMTFAFAHRGRAGVDTVNIRATDLGANGVAGGGDDTVLFSEDFSTDNTAWKQYIVEMGTASGNAILLESESVSAAGGNAAVGNFLDSVSVFESTLKDSSTVKLLYDKDSDGIGNADDVDDDNDGILDTEEGYLDLGPEPTLDGVEDLSFPTGYWLASYYEGHNGIPDSGDSTPVNGSNQVGGPTYHGEAYFGFGENSVGIGSNGSAVNDRWDETETPTSPSPPPGYVGTTWTSSGNPYYEVIHRRTVVNDGVLSFGGGPNEVVDDALLVRVNGVVVFNHFPGTGSPDPRPGLGGVGQVDLNIQAGDEIEIVFVNLGFIGGYTFTYQTPTDNRDSDGDGLDDHCDIDSDNDGITDNVEAQSTAGYVPPSGIDLNNDGLDDAYDIRTVTAATAAATQSDVDAPVDTDSDGIADYLDTDSDNDGTPDVDEAGHGIDQATLDASGDSDGDGLMDAVDEVDGNTVGWDSNDEDVTGPGDFNLTDTDGDVDPGRANADPLNVDYDFREGLDKDGDNVNDGDDVDDDNDGILDVTETTFGQAVSDGFETPPTAVSGSPDHHGIPTLFGLDESAYEGDFFIGLHPDLRETTLRFRRSVFLCRLLHRPHRARPTPATSSRRLDGCWAFPAPTGTIQKTSRATTLATFSCGLGRPWGTKPS